MTSASVGWAISLNYLCSNVTYRSPLSSTSGSGSAPGSRATRRADGREPPGEARARLWARRGRRRVLPAQRLAPPRPFARTAPGLGVPVGRVSRAGRNLPRATGRAGRGVAPAGLAGDPRRSRRALGTRGGAGRGRARLGRDRRNRSPTWCPPYWRRPVCAARSRAEHRDRWASPGARGSRPPCLWSEGVATGAP